MTNKVSKEVYNALQYAFKNNSIASIINTQGDPTFPWIDSYAILEQFSPADMAKFYYEGYEREEDYEMLNYKVVQFLTWLEELKFPAEEYHVLNRIGNKIRELGLTRQVDILEIEITGQGDKVDSKLDGREVF